MGEVYIIVCFDARVPGVSDIVSGGIIYRPFPYMVSGRGHWYNNKYDYFQEQMFGWSGSNICKHIADQLDMGHLLLYNIFQTVFSKIVWHQIL